MSPAAFNFADDQALINAHAEAKARDEDGPSAADYDPTVDMKEDERRDELRHGTVGLHGEPRHAVQDEAAAVAVRDKPDEAAKKGGEDDDDFDMFAEDFDEQKYAPPATAKADTAQEGQPGAGGGGILEGDDEEGYYKIRPGDVLDGRYQISTVLGRGMFSNVARAVDITSKNVVAIKIMRNNDALRKGGFTEIAILQKLNETDPDNKKHIIRFERSFEHKGHLCMAFENLSMNLREVLKKFGNNVGINLNATRAYAYQIFLALGHMRKCSIIHADLKPDNILVRPVNSRCGVNRRLTNRLHRSTRPGTCSRSVTWALRLTVPMPRRPRQRSCRTWSADSTELLKSCWASRLIMPSTCGPSAARCTSSTRARSCLRGRPTTRCSKTSWRSGESSAPSCTAAASAPTCILTSLAGSSASSATG